MRATHTSLTFTVIALAGLGLAGDANAKPKPPPAPPAVKPPPPVADKAPPVKPAPPPAPAPPTAPAAIADQVKARKGTWKCKGSMFMPDGSSMTSEGTFTVKLDLDKFWAHATYVGKGKAPYKFESYRTIDATSGKWHQVTIDNVGGHEVGTSAGPEGSKITWLTEARGPMGARKSRHSEDIVGPELRMWGETSMDGKSWIKSYESVCKK